MSGRRVVVISRTLRPEENPDIQIISELTRGSVAALRSDPGTSPENKSKDIWLFGGRETAGALLEIGEVDSIEVSVIPVLLGKGIPLLPSSTRITNLRLVRHEVFPTGRIHVVYSIQ